MQVSTGAISNYISLTEIAKLAPGRPSTNAVWRWCRRGVKSRNGERVRLQHVRVGGQIFSTAEWFDEFGRALAAADEKYFDLSEAASTAHASSRNRRRVNTSRFEQERQRQIADAERDLADAGI